LALLGGDEGVASITSALAARARGGGKRGKRKKGSAGNQ
jgi:hypothetical protein